MFTQELTPGLSHDIEYQIEDIAGSWSRSLVVYWYNDPTQYCGDGIREGTEICDGADLGGESCLSQGFDTGNLACNFDCQSFDASGCRLYECGNTICEPAAGEDCVSCPADCDGIQSGNPNLKFCCGDGDGDNPVDCSDPRCNDGGMTCEP